MTVNQAALTITGISIANKTYDGTTAATISGTAEASSLVSVFAGTSLIGRATAAADGAWSFTPDHSLAPGTHALTAKASDTAGNTGVASASSAHTVTAAGLSFLPVTGDNTIDSLERDTSNTPNLTLRGTTTGSQVWVRVDGGAAASATVARTLAR